MCRTISFKGSMGMDSAVRVLTTMRRKQFDIKGFSMVSLDDETSEFKIMVEEKQKESFERAILHMRKLVDVYDVSEASK